MRTGNQRNRRPGLLRGNAHRAAFRITLLAGVYGVGGASILAACGTFDYGDAPVDEVEVSTTAPNWESDIKPLMVLKCMNCHTASPGGFVPSDTPPLKLDEKNTFKDYMVSVKKRVFETPSRPMPPNFGTPLTPNELAALKKYLSDLEKTPDPTVSPTATQPGEPATPVVKFSEVKPYFSTYCGATGGCHGPTNEATGPYVTLEQIKPARSKLRARMVRTDSGKMPKEGSPQPADAEKTKMLDWLQNGSDD